MSILFNAANRKVVHTIEESLAGFVVIVAVSVLMLLGVQASAQTWTWTTDKVARGSTTSIALDAEQNLHLTYLTRDYKMYYALKPAGASRWFSMVAVDSTQANVNVYPRVAVDSKGRPHMCIAFGVLLYITLADHQWVKQQIDPGSGTISYHCSIAVGPDGQPHVGWYHERLPGGKTYAHFRHADLENGVWVVRSVDGGISGKWSSMVVDSKGFPHASYSQFARAAELKYAEWNGSTWSLTTVDSSGNVSSYRGYDNSLALSPDGSPHISYVDGRTLKYAHEERGKWIIEKVDVLSSGFDYYGGSTTVLLDSSGNPHIVYGDFGAVKHAFWDGKKWKIETVVSGALQQYNNVDAVFGPKDVLYISYPDPEDGFVKIATGKPATNVTVTKKDSKD